MLSNQSCKYKKALSLTIVIKGSFHSYRARDRSLYRPKGGN